MNQSHSISKKVLAWSVDLYTASGILAGFMSILAISEKNWRAAMAWLLVALVIDGTDGTFARQLKTTNVLPFMNSKHIDYVVDFTNYAVIPAYFFYAAGLVPTEWNLPLTFLILLVSAVYYGIEEMVSDDFNFVGFPVMWNMVVFYLIFVFSFGEWGNAAIVVTFSIMHFVPIKFAYPSRAKRLKFVTIAFTTVLLIVMPIIVWFYPNVPDWLKWIAIMCLAYFGVLAILDTFFNNSTMPAVEDSKNQLN